MILSHLPTTVSPPWPPPKLPPFGGYSVSLLLLIESMALPCLSGHAGAGEAVEHLRFGTHSRMLLASELALLSWSTTVWLDPYHTLLG